MLYMFGAVTLGSLVVVGVVSVLAIRAMTRVEELEKALDELGESYDTIESKLNYFSDINAQMSHELGIEPDLPENVAVYH